MAARRPFRDSEDLLRAADEVWSALDGADWLEAFSHHARIGERVSGMAQAEQAGTRGASAETLKRLATLNQQYERRFGHVFLICATGKSAEEMLSSLEERLRNEPAVELRAAAAEQAKITRLRLQKMLQAAPADTAR